MSKYFSRLLKYASIILLALFIASCGRLSNEKLADEVKKSMVETFKQKQGITLDIKSLILTKKAGNEYSGILETNESGNVVTNTVEVIYDGDSFKWEIVK